MSEIKEYAQIVFFVCGALAAFSTFVAVGLPVIGKYPTRVRRVMGEIFTGDLRDDLKEQSTSMELKMQETTREGTRAIHELTEVVQGNHSEALEQLNVVSQKLHEHASNDKLHRREL